MMILWISKKITLEIIQEVTSVKTRVFSDSFSSYQVQDFSNIGLILKRVNHGSLHTITIESLWHQKQSITNNFTGLNIE